MPLRDSVTYNLLISAFCWPSEQSLRLYAEMSSIGIRQTSTTFSSIIVVCTNASFHREVAQVLSLDFYGTSSLVVHLSIFTCTRAGLSNLALELFDELPERNLAVWNVMLRGFCELGLLEGLLGFHSQMCFEGVQPNGTSFSYLLRGCSNETWLQQRKKLHRSILKMGLVESNIFVVNALVDFYSACGCLVGARKSFEAIPVEDVISWNSLVSVYAHNNLLFDALESK